MLLSILPSRNFLLISIHVCSMRYSSPVSNYIQEIYFLARYFFLCITESSSYPRIRFSRLHLRDEYQFIRKNIQGVYRETISFWNQHRTRPDERNCRVTKREKEREREMQVICKDKERTRARKGVGLEITYEKGGGGGLRGALKSFDVARSDCPTYGFTHIFSSSCSILQSITGADLIGALPIRESSRNRELRRRPGHIHVDLFPHMFLFFRQTEKVARQVA